MPIHQHLYHMIRATWYIKANGLVLWCHLVIPHCLPHAILSCLVYSCIARLDNAPPFSRLEPSSMRHFFESDHGLVPPTPYGMIDFAVINTSQLSRSSDGLLLALLLLVLLLHFSIEHGDDAVCS